MGSDRVLVIGSGGREHAIVWKLSQSSKIGHIFVLPGSDEIGKISNVSNLRGVDVKDFNAIAKWCIENRIELVVVGPEDPLADGIADVLVAKQIRCFGPTKAGAQIESDKSWSKRFMDAFNIPTARFETFTDVDAAKKFINSAPYEALVVKASGLAAGKGVVVAETREEACLAVDEILGQEKFGTAGQKLVIEEKLSGEEISLLAFVDGQNVQVMLPAQDHKRLGDNDTGPNTGGMGAYCPCPLISAEHLDFARKEILEKTVAGLRSSNINYCGVLYAGLMLTPDGPKTLEFNCRFGDPETQVILPLLETDLYDIMVACCDKKLSDIKIEWKSKVSAVGVVMASPGYPYTSKPRYEITGLPRSSNQNLIFHSGTVIEKENVYFTNGGRVLINVSLNADLKLAAAEATKRCETIKFVNGDAKYRTDIAHKAFKYIQLSYKDSGVDINAGDDLVQRIKPLARGTNRAGVIGGLGGFGGLFKINELRYRNVSGQEVSYRDPVLVEKTSGIGAKLKLAMKYKKYESIGLDLVAMNVNEIIASGAQPIAFLDYIACNKLVVPLVAQIVAGIADGCRQANCALLGGETAEMPALFSPGSYDLAGYCVGVLEYGNELPTVNTIREGDLIIGLPANGLHCAGFNYIIEISKNIDVNATATFSETNSTYVDEFLQPSRNYAAEILPLIYKRTIKAAAHIANGGLLKNIAKALPKNLVAELEATSWRIPNIYAWLLAKFNDTLSDLTILNSFNCGIGMAIVVSKDDLNWKQLKGAVCIGKIITNNGKKQPVSIRNFANVLKKNAQVYGYVDENNRTDILAKDSSVKSDFLNKITELAQPTITENVYNVQDVDYKLTKKMYRIFGNGERSKTYKDPVLVIGTDGIGSKILIAKLIQKYDTIGIDLVAMCVNDILCNGADPITFLDYYACREIDSNISPIVLSGVVEGVRQSESALIDGKTFEMPDLYEEEDEFDLAGFALGIVEEHLMLPRQLTAGDIVIGLPSDGVHSNGFSLVHKVMKHAGHSFNDTATFSSFGKTFGEELLTPTKIYVSAIKPLLASGHIKAVAHITGGGLLENIPRVLPENLAIKLHFNNINIQPVFGWLAAAGNVNDIEMQRTYNCGIGLILVVSPQYSEEILESLLPHGGSEIGTVIDRSAQNKPVLIDATEFSTNIKRVQRTITVPKKRVAVLISGTGSNLQALIDATRNTTMGIGSEIVLVLSNKKDVLGLSRAAAAGIPHKWLSHLDFKSREEFDAAMSAELEQYGVDIICLAGFMRILSTEFVRKWKGRIINIHPSLLPKHPGLNVQKKALDAGDSHSGCTIHFVDEGVDTGDIILQQKVRICPGETEESLTQKIHRAEHYAYPIALRMISTGIVPLP